MNKAFVILNFIFFLAIQSQASTIQITNDENDCLDGWISMDVRVQVEDESFSFSPSCRFSFDEDFKTQSGQSCQIRAGMCSDFSPLHKIEVTCNGVSADPVEVKCPEEK